MDKETKETSIDAEIEIAEVQEHSTIEDNDELSEIERLKAEVAAWEDKFLRTHASFENSKILLAKDKATAVAYANESFASDILTVIDSLDSALNMINIDESADNNEFMKKMNGGKQMKDTDWVFKICKGAERLKDKNGVKAHPTQKPLKLVQQVLMASSNKGDIVFDPFMGTGTTAVVAEALGRKWFGIERDKKYVELAEKRIRDFIK